MSSNLICPTRDAVVAYLNAQIVAQGITPALTAVAAYEAVADLQDLAGARLLVIPRDLASELLTMDLQDERKPKIDVILQYKTAATTTALLDPYLKLAEALCQVLLGQTMTSGAVCTDAEWLDGAFDRQILQDYNVLHCSTTYTFTDAY
jgi:hypothetical protein